ncbi:hypothetical protein C8250_034265 [Streptomyces sp. So13.3]|uniref:DUF6059 family protein n=1 Tax=Streptomyces TaxID=1883 RepID=UPI0011074B23|nr:MULTISPECIES: DUF6059 family protein [unclassified Streptomyces]MCZ4098704.1 hypothetical protein [Streptomyces sp. H39-C1]QNA76267.1 hypothetical protein C8250_034265 [Streptomyces sp. So13.3]
MLIAIGEGLMVHGGRDMYLASRPDHHACWEHGGSAGAVCPAALHGPPPGHPERLCPEVPLTAQEHQLMRDLGHLGWKYPKNSW